MKLVKVIKNGEVVQPVRFDNDADMNQWIKMLADTGAWGLPERWLVDSPLSHLSEEDKAKAVESRKVVTVEAKPESTIQVQKELEDGSIVIEDEVVPAAEEQFYMEYKFAAEYDVEVEDVSAQVEQEAVNKAALEYLASTDWMIVREVEGGSLCPVEVKQARAAARARIVR